MSAGQSSRAAGRVAELSELRALDPGRVAAAWRDRRRPDGLPADGRLMIIAADHPARGALGVRDRADAMADRGEMLARLLVALDRPGVDGVLGTADVLDDLVLLGALEDKHVFGSMNRGGLAGSVFELDDRITGYRPERLAERGMQGGKMLLRIDPGDPATVATLETCATMIDGLADRGLLAMLEPFWAARSGGRLANQLDPESVIRSIHVAAGLGSASERTWLKLPVVDECEQVMAATTLPVLLLGGDPTGAPAETYRRWARALRPPQVRGLVIGRSLLYPPDGDVAGAVSRAAALVHEPTNEPTNEPTQGDLR
ncbi:Cgl0159 family (beta/alpha)8-fold protein [Naumannella cuiyingiana]|uniref:Cgl0159-like domain-containing protein n=1 Tax=Naumannella cuiyingiana TaxID=1347891 RepID=A0A7Z0D8H5_9ACTN|nr:deoxyribose-phosphate aldolase [Naumannella cuiyingiana]NYI70827.1 hypothetical protein [Naumannella cuiyingiana]